MIKEAEVSNEGALKQVIIVIGATGTGKSDLAIQIAKELRCRGEVINADAMQCYSGLPIGTNLPTEHEQSLVPHHLFAFRPPTASATCLDWVPRAARTIDEIVARGSAPVVVGGTHYYIEALLTGRLVGLGSGPPCGTSGPTAPLPCKPSFEQVTATPANTSSPALPCDPTPSPPRASDSRPSCTMTSTGPSSPCSSSQATTTADTPRTPQPAALAEHYRRLQEVDPDSAAFIHPRNARKILRALQVFDQTGVPLSAHVAQQNNECRYDCVFLWTHASADALDARLDRRVDHMMERGLLGEARALYAEARRPSADECTAGLLQSIGFKEFIPYLEAQEGGKADTDEAQSLLASCVAQLKAATRQYARKQLKWIRRRLIARHSWPVFALDTSDPAQWDVHVLQPALEIAQAHLAGRLGTLPAPLASLRCAEPLADVRAGEPRFWCERCQLDVYGQTNYQAHLKSRRHRKRRRVASQSDSPRKDPET